MFHVKRTPPAACRTGRDAPAVAPIKNPSAVPDAADHRHQPRRRSARSRSRLARLNNTPGSCPCQKPARQTAATQNPSRQIAPTKTLPGPTPASPRWKPGDQPQHKVPFPTRTAVASMAARFTMVVSRETGKPARLRKPGRFHVKRHHHAATDDKNNDSCRYTDSTLHAWWFHY